MYQFKLAKIGKNTAKTDWLSAIALGAALLGIATASILIAIASEEMQPNAITCDRLIIATIVFSCWNALTISKKDTVTSPYTIRAIALLTLAGVSFAISLALWAWSLTQTSIANSTLLNNMMPIFTTLGGWLLFRKNFRHAF